MNDIIGYLWGSVRLLLLAITPLIAFAFLSISFRKDFSKSARASSFVAGAVVALLSIVFYGLLLGNDNLVHFGLYPFVTTVSLTLYGMQKAFGEYAALGFFVLVFVVGPLAARALFKR